MNKKSWNTLSIYFNTKFNLFLVSITILLIKLTDNWQLVPRYKLISHQNPDCNRYLGQQFLSFIIVEHHIWIFPTVGRFKAFQHFIHVCIVHTLLRILFLFICCINVGIRWWCWRYNPSRFIFNSTNENNNSAKKYCEIVILICSVK